MKVSVNDTEFWDTQIARLAMADPQLFQRCLVGAWLTRPHLSVFANTCWRRAIMQLELRGEDSAMGLCLAFRRLPAPELPAPWQTPEEGGRDGQS